MKWLILYAKERQEVVKAENLNHAAEIANQNKREGEKVVRIGIR